jgi:ribosomal-protein-alanine N-acetyltransferase
MIRHPKAEDAQAFIAAVKRSGDVHGPWINRKALTAKEFSTYLERYKSDRHCGFFVIEKKSGAIVGVINVNDIIRGALQSASLGYYAFAPYAGRGLMFEGLKRVVRHAFTKLKLHRLEANIQPANRRSIALAKKCGFVREGLSRRFVKVRGHWRDHERWALLAEDYRPKAKSRKATIPR